MMKNPRGVRLEAWLVAALALALLIVGCSKVARNPTGGSTASVTTESKPLVITDRIKIGIVSPITGDQAKIGQDLRNGALLAVDEANKRGGIGGFKVQSVPQDDKHDPREAVIVANRFVSEPDMAVVVGHLNSACTMPAGAIYAKAGVLEISPASTNPDISKQGYATFFRDCATDAVQAPSAADFAYQKLGKRKFAILHDKSTYGEGLAKQFRAELGKLGVKELMYEGITQGDQDFNAILSRVKSVNPEAIYFGGMYPEGAMLARQARDMGLNAPFIGADGIMDAKYVEMGGKATEGDYGTFLSPPAESLPAAADFVKGYNKSYGEVGPYSAYAYDAANIAMKAIEQAIKKDGKKTANGTEVPREAILREMRAIHDYPGITGKVTFDKNGDPENQIIHMYVVKGGKWAYIGPARGQK